MIPRATVSRVTFRKTKSDAQSERNGRYKSRAPLLSIFPYTGMCTCSGTFVTPERAGCKWPDNETPKAHKREIKSLDVERCFLKTCARAAGFMNRIAGDVYTRIEISRRSSDISSGTRARSRGKVIARGRRSFST